MRVIEVGAIKIHLGENEETEKLLQNLLRPLSNKEVASLIDISERTVARWKSKGRLPARSGGELLMVDLLRHLGTPT